MFIHQTNTAEVSKGIRKLKCRKVFGDVGYSIQKASKAGSQTAEDYFTNAFEN